MTPDIIYIRSSMLPSWNDCPRRSAAQQYRKEIVNAGYTLRQREPSVGGIIGTAVHAGSTNTLSIKLTTGEYADVSDCIEIGIDSMRIEIADGAIMDATTATKNIAETQTIQMIKSYCIQIAPTIIPAIMPEKQRQATILPGVIFTGKSDVETVDNAIRDVKGGVKEKMFHGQLGGYSLLKKADTKTATDKLFIDYLPRVSPKKTYPGAKTIKYNVALCEEITYYTILQIAKSVSTYRKTGNVYAFPCNPMSVLCSDKYCQAFKTNFCEIYK